MSARGLLLAGGCLLALLTLCSSVAVMSIDLGSEWIKVGVVSPGVPMDIALNRESKRKTPSAVALRDGERIFGEDALTVGVRFPALSYQYLLSLAGKRLSNPAVAEFRRRFPYYTLEADPDRGTVLFRHDAETVFSLEELLSMILTQARTIASEHTQQAVTDAVVTVPAFFSQAERQAVLTAASLAGVKVLQLMNDNAAVALNYGMFRRKDFNASAQFILFYDMGAESTSATLVGYQLVKTKDRGFTETNPQLQIHGYAYDRSLGGLEMTQRLQQHLAKAFTEKKKTKEDIYASPRAMAKLLKEAERVKKILSANAETTAQVEGLLDEEDFRHHVTRTEFEALCEDMLERVTAPLEAAVKSAGIELDQVDQLILAGAATRVPFVQEQLATKWGRELGKSINTDEAAALGAVYRAADLSTGFKVMKFHVKDYVMLPIGVDFERDSEEPGEPARQVHRNLFTLGNPYPQKKVITFNRSQKDFGFAVNYGDMSHLSAQDVAVVDGLNLTYVLLDGVPDVYAEHAGDGVESKGLKVHFQMDDSGLLNLTGVEAVFEKTSGGGAGGAEEDDASALSKLSSAFGKLFSGDDNKDDGDKVEDSEDTGESENKPEDKKEAKKADEKNKTAEKDANKTEAKEEKPKIRVVKVPVKFKSTNLNVAGMEGEAYEKAKQKIADLDEQDRQRKRRELARNLLESFVNDMQTRLYEEIYEQSSTEEERGKIQKAASEMSDWLYDEGFDETAAVFEHKLEEMNKLTQGFYDRVEEHKARAETVQALRDILNMTEHFLVQAGESLKQEIIVESDVSSLRKMVSSTQEWLKAKLKDQAETPLTQTPKLKMKTMASKYLDLDKEVKYVVNKMKAGAARKAREEADAKIKEAAAKLEAELKKKEEEAAANATDSTNTTGSEPGSEGAEETASSSEGAAAATPAPAEEGQGTPEEATPGAEPATEAAGEENDTESDKRKGTAGDDHSEL